MEAAPELVEEAEETAPIPSRCPDCKQRCTNADLMRGHTCPKVGDTRQVYCSWCQRVLITETFRRYPPDTLITDGSGYWDGSECRCIEGLRAGRTDTAMFGMGRHPNFNGNHNNGKPKQGD